MKLIRSRKNYTRDEVNKDDKNIYIFTDNTNRTSGNYKISDDSEYSKRFGLTGLRHPTMTSAVIRGCKRAFPLTTMKLYANNFPSGTNVKWDDSDFEEFKKVIDDDVEHIKQAIRELKPEAVIFPVKGVLNSKKSEITLTRTPKLFAYILEKEKELYLYNPEENEN